MPRSSSDKVASIRRHRQIGTGSAMATQSERSAILDFGLVETLFAGAVNESLRGHEGLLGALRDVDVRGPKQRTLLHLAVRAGRVDWVQRLLEMGADPGLRDADGHTVADVAGYMVTWLPEEEDRARIREMVLGKLGQDGAPGSAVTFESSPPNIDACGETEVTKGIKDIIAMVTRLSDEVTSLKSGVSSETSSMKESLDSLSTEITSLKGTQLQHCESASAEISAIKEEIATISKDAALIKENQNAMRAEVKSHIEGQLGLEEAVKEVRKGVDTSSNEIRNVKLSLTSLAEEWGPWKEQVKGEFLQLKTDNEGFKSSISEIFQNVQKSDKEKVRDNCIASMMDMTEILDSSDERITKVRQAYQGMYSQGQMTSSLLTFLQFQQGVKVRIDYSSNNIGRMKVTFTDHDGVERIGRYCYYFTDLEEKTSYVGGGWGDKMVSGLLSSALSQLAVSLAFRNGGRPYREGDGDRGREMARVVQAAEEEKGKGRLEYGIRVALDKKTQSAKETYLIAAVPAIIAEQGSTNGTSILIDQAPSLLSFYTDHVLPALSP